MTDTARAPTSYQVTDDDGPSISLVELGYMLAAGWRLILGSFVFAALAGFGVVSFVPSWYTGKTVILPPQQQQSAAAAAISQLGALAGLAGGMTNLKSPSDQYVSLMQSTTVSDRIIERFKLSEVYDEEYRHDTRRKLKENVRIGIGRKDGLITVEVDDRDPQRAAAMANAYVEQLRQITNSLAVSEAQQRRVFFEQQLAQTKDRLGKAQGALEESGFSQGALKIEPKSAAEDYARLRAQATAAEVRLQTLRRSLADTSPEVAQQQATLTALRELVSRAEQRDGGRGGSDYIDKYREFKFQEALFEIFVKQYELAKLDESREGALIQVVDSAEPPERKAGPKRGFITGMIAIIALLTACLYVVATGFLARRGAPPSPAI